MPTITEIRESSFQDGGKSGIYDGYIITMDDGQTIELGISNGQSCCENWGYFITNDTPDEFIGAKVITVNIVNDCLEVDKAPKMYKGGVMFVNVETDRGTLQFTAYNEHNGYYGHTAIVTSSFLTDSEYL